MKPATALDAWPARDRRAMRWLLLALVPGPFVWRLAASWLNGAGLFVDEAHDFGSTSDADGRSLFSVSRQAVPKAEDLAPKVETAATRPINLVALLKGDVTGNWAPEPDAATLPPTYFDELANTRTLMVSSSPVVL